MRIELTFSFFERNDAGHSRARKRVYLGGMMKKRRKQYTRQELESKSQEELIEIILAQQAPRKTSGNSSCPPSLDQKSNEAFDPKWGGKPGHPGRGKVRSTPDKVVKVSLDRCPACQRSLSHHPEVETTAHQTVEVEIVTRTVEYQRVRKYCPRCGKRVTAPAPEEMPSGRFAPEVEALSSYFHFRHHIPQQRLLEVLRDVFGVSMSKGKLNTILTAPPAQIQAFYETLAQQLATQEVLGVDETGYRVCKHTHWLWVFQNAHLTFFTLEPSRGSRVLQAVLGKVFEGTLVSDFFSAYNRIQARKQKCNAHLLRELKYILEKEPELDYAARLLQLILDAKTLAEQRKNYLPLAYQTGVTRLKLRREALLQEPLPQSSDSRRIQKRLRKYQEDIFRFLEDETVPFDNNGAEREIRGAVIHRKVSACFRSEKGPKAFAQLTSFLQTSRKRGQNIFQRLVEAYRINPAPT